jgi:hypothetical protein
MKDESLAGCIWPIKQAYITCKKQRLIKRFK